VSSRWKQGLLALPSVGFSMLPKLACPACWPAYAGLLTSIGLGFLISAVYLLPLTVAFLALALGAMVFRARARHGYKPFLLGLVAASGVLIGKFVWEATSHHVRWSRAARHLFALEYMAASRRTESGGKLFRLQ